MYCFIWSLNTGLTVSLTLLNYSEKLVVLAKLRHIPAQKLHLGIKFTVKEAETLGEVMFVLMLAFSALVSGHAEMCYKAD